MRGQGMFKLSARLQSGRKALARMAERKAFESYIRCGAVSETFAALSAVASDEQKFLDLCASLSTKGLGNGRATTHYTWRTAGDDKVRHAHAALNGQVFSWSSPPEGGHPGTAHNCRCWAEPYFGDPAVPDAMLQLARDRQVLSDPTQRISSIETLTRPDGSIAASSIDLTDGTSISSIFQGPSVSQLVSFPDGMSYQSLRLGISRDVTVRQDGETRLRVAQLRLFAPGARPPLVMPQFPAANSTDLGGPSLVEITAAPWGTMIRGALELYNAAIASPRPSGLGEGDLSIVAIKVWQGIGDESSATVTKEALTAEQAARTCQRLPLVQQLTNEAAAKLAIVGAGMTAQQFGTALHTFLHRTIVGLKEIFPLEYGDVSSELSITRGGVTSANVNGPRYSEAGTTRLDVVEQVNESTVCIYDIKSGRRGLTAIRVQDFVERATKMPGVTTVIVIQVGVE
jgi:SPP1 gp7 family putative phage head morphogenesis protein